MAGASISVYEFDIVVRGQQVYKSVGFHSLCAKLINCIPVLEDGKRDKHAIND